MVEKEEGRQLLLGQSERLVIVSTEIEPLLVLLKDKNRGTLLLAAARNMLRTIISHGLFSLLSRVIFLSLIAADELRNIVIGLA